MAHGALNEVIPDTRQTRGVRQLLTRITGTFKITDHAETNIDGPIPQILHSEGTASIDHWILRRTEYGCREVLIHGIVHSWKRMRHLMCKQSWIQIPL